MKKDHFHISDALDFLKKDCERIRKLINKDVEDGKISSNKNNKIKIISGKFSIYAIDFSYFKFKYIETIRELREVIEAKKIGAKNNGLNLICEDVKLIVDDRRDAMLMANVQVHWEANLKYEKI